MGRSLENAPALRVGLPVSSAVGLFGAVLIGLLVGGCAGTRPDNLGVREARLAPCAASPNCVSSDASDAEHAVAPFALAGEPRQAWRVAVGVVSDLPRTTIIAETPSYLHVECRSAVFGFVDDLELHLRASDGLIAVRSASRLGHSDFGVNRGRVEALRSTLVSRGVVK